ncbi:hypothetical protein L3Y34_007223 [Caenorhabditis briggsae]|uniref:Uncharacterized protein n=1 Tax=Caenorhabditis briggsae TaxID=6238 RepID=A0AAE9D0L1_CAEBR|nr:hypothetical protein L3Y34_007223 [Caenorhabditis briggsae]
MLEVDRNKSQSSYTFGFYLCNHQRDHFLAVASACPDTSAPTAAANSAANEAVTLTFAFAVRSAAKLAESSAAASAVMVAPASIWAEYQFMDDNEIEFKNCDIVLRNSSAS